LIFAQLLLFYVEPLTHQHVSQDLDEPSVVEIMIFVAHLLSFLNHQLILILLVTF